ncbi:ABC transporter permease [Cohnella algarum]|uniref:ABC transporter permease n=1 Tax=Cohnella algarum TaxID=2044859 RepID=UPI00196793B3|nr:ABC transporter permease [Cohnella algarum]MBN2984173.1 ABC transporter permease [Cohnella algarum]
MAIRTSVFGRAQSSSSREGTLAKTRLNPLIKDWWARSRLPLVAFVGFFVLWESFVRLFGVDPLTLPTPSAVFRALFSEFGFYVDHAMVTLYEAVAGFSLGAGVALLFGVVLAHSPALERMLLPLAVLASVTPVVAIAPLLIIWFGFGALPKVLIAAIITFFPMLVNSITGFRAVDPNRYDYMRSLCAGKREIFFKLRLPGSLPYLFSAAKTCISLSVIGAVVAEWSGSSEGLGNVVMMFGNYMQTVKVFAAIMMLAAMGILLTAIVGAIEKKVLAWSR